MPGKWIRRPQGAAASAVFVHGILSSGETCWRNDNGSYWPGLLKKQPELGSLGIYVFTYETGIFSGSYRLSDIVDDLKENMRVDGVLASDRLIFVCHSMGGIVARKYIVERQAELIGAGKEIDLFLVASPSLGASYADWLSPLARFLGHEQADALRFVRNNNWLMDLDKEFINLKEGGKLKIKGKELVEDKFVILPKFWRRQVVEPFAGARYFGEPYKVPQSDHFSIAKPTDKDAIQHRLLCQFILENALSPARPLVAPSQSNHGITPPKPPDPARAVPADISRIIKYAPERLIGREAETLLLVEAWAKAQNNETKRPHVLTFVALGGEGKTSLVAKWAADLAYQNWPGCDAAFAWSFYSQGTREQVAASSDVFLKEALTFFGDPDMAGSAQGAFDKGRRLAGLVGERRALLVLDGLEPLQYAPTSPTPGELKDSGIAALLKGLAANNNGLCVVTTRYSIPDLRAFRQTTAPQVNLLRLSKEAGVALLRSLGVKGMQPEFETLVEDVKGHALTLNLVGAWLRDAHAGDIRKRDLVRLEEADAEEQGGHAFRVMDAYVQWFESEGEKGKRALAMLRLLGLFDRPTDAGCLKALWKAPAIPGLTEPLVAMSEAQRNVTLTRLEHAKLLTVNWDGSGALLALDAHPLLRAYFSTQLREHLPEAWRAAHRRLFEHLCATTEDNPQPTLEDLQPLYQAVSHGCQAGMQQEACGEVLFYRIQRRNEEYSTRKLGAFGSNLGAVACFFEHPWSRVSPALTEAAQAWLLANAAFSLGALGRLTEALEPVRAALGMKVKLEDWKNASIAASNLSQLELTLGEVASAAADAEQSVIYAERSGDALLRMAGRTVQADALHQAGRRGEAEARFREAEVMQAGDHPEYPLLLSVQGFLYCDLLLGDAERAAWRRALQSSRITQPSSLLESCRAVSLRAARTFHRVEVKQGKLSLLDTAIDHLTLGRAALYGAVLEGLALDRLDPCRESLQHAVNGLRRAGTQDYLPRGLLTRSWLRCLSGAHTGPDSAQSDLNEAFEIAERGPMPLFMADIHLHRARLFGLSKDRPASYPWTSPQTDLAEARRLIEKHGYWRRKEELEDAEAAG
jgi:tetratricopeptide (TPR) repeat protein